MRDDDTQSAAGAVLGARLAKAMTWYLVTLILIAGLAWPGVLAQQPPPAPVVQPFNDGAYWVVTTPFTYNIGQTTYQIVVPAGFVTDFASIPAWMRGFLSPTGQERNCFVCLPTLS